MDRERLIAGAAAGTVAQRVVAIDRLGELRNREAVSPLVQLLRDEDEAIRVATCAALGMIADARAVAPLVSLLRDPDEDVRGEAFSALLAIGQSRAGSIPSDALQSEDPAHPSFALTQIVWPADLEAVKLLVTALSDPDPEIRIGAAYTLGRLGILGALGKIAQLVHTDDDQDVRAAAAFALGDLAERGEGAAIQHLVRAWPHSRDYVEMSVAVVRSLANSPTPDCFQVFTEALRSDDERVRQLGVMGLGRLADPGALPRLTRCLKDSSANVQRIAIGALGSLGVKAAVRPLIEATVDASAEIRMAVGRALTRLDRVHVHTVLLECSAAGAAPLRQAATYLMGQVGLTEGLATMLRDVNGQVRKAAALAMGSGEEHQFSRELSEALADPDWSVRVAAAEGLKRLGSVGSVPVLQSRLDDEHPVVRNAARSALDTLLTASKDRLP